MGGFGFEGTPAGGVDKHVELTSIWAVEDEELGAFTRGTAMLNGLAALANPGTGWALEPVVPICACGAFGGASSPADAVWVQSCRKRSCTP